MGLAVVPIDNPETVNLILGQSHFIKTVEDLHEALVGTVPGIAFGLAFCEASGPALVRASGTDDDLVERSMPLGIDLILEHPVADGSFEDDHRKPGKNTRYEEEDGDELGEP